MREQFVRDAGFQYYILTRCKLKIGRVFIVIHGPEEDNPFVPVDVTREAKGYYKLKNLILEADMLVFVMPVYYYNWPTQIKVVVDRFYSFTGELTAMRKKTALIGAAWDNTDSVFEIVTAYYRKLCDYMDFRNQGVIEGRGCGSAGMTRHSPYLEQAYELGRALKD